MAVARWAALARLALLALFIWGQWSPPGALGQGLVNDKLAHVVLYGLATVAVWPLVPVRSGRLAALVCAGFLLAVVMEAGQTGFGRANDPLDVLADLVGILVAGGLLSGAEARSERRRGSEQPDQALLS